MAYITDPRSRMASCLILCILILITGPILRVSHAMPPEYAALSQRLIADGFAPEKVAAMMDNPSVVFNPPGVSLFFVHSESRLNYDQFLSKDSIAKAADYMALHRADLEAAEQQYRVDKSIITAILLVETRLGTYLGTHNVFSTLATMATMTDTTLRDRIWDDIPAKRKISRDNFLKRVDKRTPWGYQELKSLIRFSEREGIDPESIIGSYAGAMGIPQFMPSNALTLAKDGNNDGKVDLFDPCDAIFSVANYLKHHGWKPGITRQRQQEVLYRYNHSKYYVETLLKISDRLTEG